MGWSFVAGKKATESRESSRVRVYERGGRLYITYTWQKTASGAPRRRVLPDHFTKDDAKKAAKGAARKRQAILEEKGREDEQGWIRLESLLERYHQAHTTKASERKAWSESHRKEQERCWDFWEAELGRDHVVTARSPDPGTIEEIAGAAARRNDWSGRTEEKYLKYIHAACRWGWRKKRLYGAHPLRGLEYPDYEQDTSELIYTVEEVATLSQPHPEIDWRFTLAWNLCWDTGRRRKALTRVRAWEDVEGVPVDGVERLMVTFRGEADKGRRTGRVVVSRFTERLIINARRRRAVKRGGWLLPGGHLGHLGELVEKPMTPSGLTQLLREAEDVFGVEHVKGRGWHGVKRRHVTEGFEEAGGDIGRVQETTGNVDEHVLRSRYRFPETRRTARHVDGLRDRISGSQDDS